MEDERIVQLYLDRDETAVRETTEKYGAQLQRLAFGIVCDLPTAEECENDTYLHAWNSIPPHEPVSYLYAFLARITRHISLNRCRDRSRLKRGAYLSELSAEMEQCIPSPDDTESRIDGLLLGEAVSRFLKTLPPEKRNVFLRRYFYLDSVESISARCSISKSKVKSMLFRCRNELREYLEKEGYHL